MGISAATSFSKTCRCLHGQQVGRRATLARWMRALCALLFAEDSTRKHRFDAALGHPIIAIYARPLPPKTECDELTNSAALVVAANRRAESGCVNDFVVVTLVARTSMRSCEVGDAW